MNFLVIKHHPEERLGNLERWLQKHNFTWQEIEYHQALPKSLAPYQGIIMLGGPMHVDPHTPKLSAEISLIKDCIRQQKPLLGICLGAQLIAHSLGATISSMTEAENGWQPVTTSDNLTMSVAQWHEQQMSLPQDTVLLASSPQCKVQMFQYHHHVLAMQFHPEWNNHEIAYLRNAFGSECPLEPIESEIEAQVKAWLFKQLDNWITSCLRIC